VGAIAVATIVGIRLFIFFPLEPADAVILAGDYLERVVLPNGLFLYEVDAVTNDVSDNYNILRHAGTSYSMMELFEVTQRPTLLEATQRALSYLEQQAIPCPDFPDVLCLEEANEIKLGGNGLAILAFAKHAIVTGDQRYLDTAVGLAAWILKTQSFAGEFTKHKMFANNAELDDFISDYYPGEALFALARLSAVTGDRRFIDAAHRGADWLINVRDAGKESADLNSDHWFLYALNELHADQALEQYVVHTRKITDRIVNEQHWGLRGSKKDWNGGYGDPPRSTPAATRSEGLAAAVRLFRRANDPVYEARAMTALDRSIPFQLRTQMTPAKARRLAADSISIGGFHESLDEYSIRIDYVQHNLSAILAYLKLKQDTSEQ